jgi:hypothetical protein
MAHHQSRRTGVVVLLALALAVPVTAGPSQAVPSGTQRVPEVRFRPGAPGVGDPYVPRDGNRGYDVKRYRLNLRYQPATGRLSGVATIKARSTQNLSRFNLDLDGLRVRSIRVNGHRATWTRHAGELTIDPKGAGLRQGRQFRTVVRYDGRPRLFMSRSLGAGGFFHTDDGAVVAGQPHAASAWFPANDHPTDKAVYTFRISAPRSLQVVANGSLTRRQNHGSLTAWTWSAGKPMASYLATIAIGHFDLTHHRTRGISYWDAVDSRLFQPVAAPRTGRQLAISQQADSSYKRLTRSIDVPPGGAQLSFWVNRNTEPDWDFFFVEAHTAGLDDWTTLADTHGHTQTGTGASCPVWLDLHPFLEHYQTGRADGSCAASGSTGSWHAATGSSDGYENWVLDLSGYAGRTVEVSLSQASDDSVQVYGAFVDDITVSTGPGTTSFEPDGDTLDGWTTPGAPAGSPGNTNDWVVGTAAQTPPPAGVVARASLRKQPEILAFLSSYFGRYPLKVAGGIVEKDDRIQFALETQTRPVYTSAFFGNQADGDSVIVHELAHQWYGDSLAVRRWRDIWLNEGFATYAEWLWARHEGRGTPAGIFASVYNAIPPSDPFWALKIGNPGPNHLFDQPVYLRGAMTLHRLRQVVGDHDFFRILRRWASTRSGDNVTTPQFIRLAERVSGKHLHGLFRSWLYTAGKPGVPGTSTPRTREGAQSFTRTTSKVALTPHHTPRR